MKLNLLKTAVAATIMLLSVQLVEVSAKAAYFFTKLGPAELCDHDKCELPNCRCADTNIPGGLEAEDTPQIVMFSFDDGVRVEDYDGYYSKAFNGRKNPNGCQIGLTFFVSHNFSDYSLIEYLYYTYGHEMADHSVTHREPTTWWESATEEEWTHEVMDQKAILEKWGNIPGASISGFRSPFLVTSETELKVLNDNNLLYEASMGTGDSYWPFTLDYKSPLCNSPATCPEQSYPGLWITPTHFYKQKSGIPCAMLDACTDPKTEQDWLDFFWENFNLQYKANRAPFGIYTHSAWFYFGAERLNALVSFLNKLAEIKDVYIVTHTQMLDWVRNPTPLDKISEFEPWKCPQRPEPRCDYKNPTCYKIYPDQTQLRSCTSPCPPNYPGYGNPDGN